MSYQKTLRDLQHQGWITKPPSREPENKLSAAEVDSNFLALQTEIDQIGQKVEEISGEVRATNASTTIQLSDNFKTILVDNSSARTITVPTNSGVALPVGARIWVIRAGSGSLTISAASGVALRNSRANTLRAQHSVGMLLKVATDTWYLSGDFT